MNFEFPLVCFDLDGTLVDDTIFIWSTFHEYFQTDRAIREKSKQDYFERRISYDQWFETDLELLDQAGATRDAMIEVISGLRVMPGAHEVLGLLREQGRKLAIISGSVDLVVETLFADQKFDALLINKLHFNGQGRLSGGQPTAYDMENKAKGLKKVVEQFELSTEQAAFIGDNSNDIAIARTAGRSIAFNCKSEELARVSDFVTTEHDLRGILPYL